MNEPLSRSQATKDALADRLAGLLNLDVTEPVVALRVSRAADVLMEEGWIV